MLPNVIAFFLSEELRSGDVKLILLHTYISEVEQTAVAGPVGPVHHARVGFTLLRVVWLLVGARLRDQEEVDNSVQPQPELVLEPEQQVVVVTHGRHEVGTERRLQRTARLHLLKTGEETC